MSGRGKRESVCDWGRETKKLKNIYLNSINYLKSIIFILVIYISSIKNKIFI